MRPSCSPAFRFLGDHFSGSLPKTGLQQRGKGLPSSEADLMGPGEGLPGGSDGPFSHGAITQKESPPVGSAFHARSALPNKTIIEPSMKRDNPSRQGHTRYW